MFSSTGGMERNALLCGDPGRTQQSLALFGKCLVRFLPVLLLVTACATSAPSTVPYDVEDFYRTAYGSAADHKAYALSVGAFYKQSGYASGYSYGYSNDKEARDMAILSCNEERPKFDVSEPCRLYAVGDVVVCF